MDQDLISVIMPAYNAGKFISDAIKSVISQTYTCWELLIVDDGSTDNTASIVKQNIIKDKRIKYFYQKNSKQGKARNTAIKEASGFFLAFIDADDVWTNCKLATQIGIIKKTNVDLVFSQGYITSDPDCITDFDVKLKYWNRERDVDLFLQQNQIPILSVLVKKDAVIRSGYFSEDLLIRNAEDYHLWLKLLCNNYQFLSTTHRLFYYRLHPSQSTYLNQNLSSQTIAVFHNLITTGFVSASNKVIIQRIKWLVFETINCTSICLLLELIYPDKILIWRIIKASQLFLPRKVMQKVIFHLL